MSMDVVLTGGLNLGSYSADCWPSIFAVCRHVSQLEHEIFSMQNPAISASPGSSRRDLETGEKLSNGNAQDKLNLSSIPIDDDETWCGALVPDLFPPNTHKFFSAAWTCTASCRHRCRAPTRTSPPS
ncbi:hypothetical protein M5D96_013210 [Drosophila gunungcola]|uniref:Uncharacterized protein n=1 Tax=Drosophila gunungcola TaxID=103775 RepID=A0A9P9YCB0_9MUSC|nr:hypothetical protein M5D96_013210 [Drosophila gunungcola]